MKKFVTGAVLALTVCAAVTLAGCASSSGSEPDEFAGKTFRQQMTYSDGSAATYEIAFNEDKTYVLTMTSGGAVYQRETYKYSYNAEKKLMTVQMVAQWLEPDVEKALAASTPQDFAELNRVPLSKQQVVKYYGEMIDVLADYYTALGIELTASDKKEMLAAYTKIADFNFNAKKIYSMYADGDSLIMLSQFTGMKDTHMNFYTPTGTSNAAVTSIYYISGSYLDITFEGASYVATLTNGSAPVTNTSKKTITGYLSYTDEASGAVYEFGDVTLSYTTEGTGNETLLKVTITEAPAGLKALEGTTATLTYIADSFNMQRVR